MCTFGSGTSGESAEFTAEEQLVVGKRPAIGVHKHLADEFFGSLSGIEIIVFLKLCSLEFARHCRHCGCIVGERHIFDFFNGKIIPVSSLVSEEERCIEVECVNHSLVVVFRNLIKTFIATPYGSCYDNHLLVDVANLGNHALLHLIPVLLYVAATRLIEKFEHHMVLSLVAHGKLTQARSHKLLTVALGEHARAIVAVLVENHIHATSFSPVDCIIERGKEFVIEGVGGSLSHEDWEVQWQAHHIDAKALELVEVILGVNVGVKPVGFRHIEPIREVQSLGEWDRF